METSAPTGKKNPGRGCHLLVGIQCLGSLNTLRQVYDSQDYVPTPASEFLRALAFGDEKDTKYFVESLAQLPQKYARINVKRTGSPAKFLEDAFPLIFNQDQYPMLIRTVEPQTWKNLSKAFLKNMKREISEGKLMDRVKMILVEGQYLEPTPREDEAINSKKIRRATMDHELIFGEDLTLCEFPLRYRLVAVIRHVQYRRNGHFIAYVRRSIGGVETWFKTDDDEISSTTYNEVKKIPRPEFLVYELAED